MPARKLDLTWLSCVTQAVAYFVAEDVARSHMDAVLKQLAAVSAREAAVKLKALAAVRPAFVTRNGCTARGAPCAPQCVLEDPTGGSSHPTALIIRNRKLLLTALTSCRQLSLTR